MEEFREINGRLPNAKRHSRDELERMFPHWDFSLIPQEDETWSTEEYEADVACGERGYANAPQRVSVARGFHSLPKR